MSVKSKQFLILILLAITFWFKGNTLYWIDTNHRNDSKYNWVTLQLDHKDNPTINQEPISSIKVTDKEVFIIAGGKCWILHYEGNPQTDWYIENPFSI